MSKHPIILILEDERPLLLAIKAKLETRGFEVVTGRTVAQAMGYLEDGVHVDAIWLDHYLLGSESGLDFVARIKEEKSPWVTVPIFVVSNTASEDMVEAYLQLGVEKYYAKTMVRLGEVIDDIDAVLHTK